MLLLSPLQAKKLIFIDNELSSNVGVYINSRTSVNGNISMQILEVTNSVKIYFAF